MNTCPHCGAEQIAGYGDWFKCGSRNVTFGMVRTAACSEREPLFQELQSAKARIEALEIALLPFAQIGDIANDPDCTLWKRSVSAGSVRLARGVLESKKP